MNFNQLKNRNVILKKEQMKEIKGGRFISGWYTIEQCSHGIGAPIDAFDAAAVYCHNEQDFFNLCRG